MVSRILRASLAVGCLIAVLAGLVAAAGPAAGSVVVGGRHVDGWPYRTLRIGITSSPGQAASQHHQAPFSFRYQYLAGGVNTGDPWEDWGSDFVAKYISESEAADEVPVFSYYEVRQSAPGASTSDESLADRTNLTNRATMLTYFKNLKDFFKQAADAKGPVIVQFEPDLWGYIQQAARNNNAASIPAAVASSGMPDLRGMPNNASGLAQAVLVLRNNYAPRVIVAYPDSIWGTGTAIQLNHPSTAEVRKMAGSSVAFYHSLHARFDALFTEVSDRDAGYAQVVDGEGTTWWWQQVDYQHLADYIAGVHQALKLPVTVWQIPVGNNLFRVENNTPYHYQDNAVQSLLGSSSAARSLLRSYAKAGVAALLFGGGQATDTCACENGHTPAHEPAPIDGNTRRSLNGDDDGGYLMTQVARYYKLGALRFS
jgi:hypothetical protein